MDREGMAIIESQDLAAFQKYLSETKNTICGRNPIQLLLALIEAAKASDSDLVTEFVKYD